MAQVGQPQIGVFQVTSFQIDSRHPGTGQVGMPDHGVGQPSAWKVGTAQVNPGQIQLQFIPGRRTVAKQHKRRLDVRSPVVQPGQLLVNGRCRVLRTVWGADQPGSMGADQRAEDFCDGPSVGRRVPGYTLQGEDATEAHVRCSAAELVNRPGEPLGDLPFPVDLDLPPGRDGPGDQQQAGDALQQRGPSVVLQSGLGLLQLDSLVGACHALQLCRGQRGVQKTREHQDAGQQRQHRHGRQDSQPACWPAHPCCSLLTKANACPP